MILWDFATTFYKQPGVAQACLELQESCGLDVVGLMFAAWTGSEHGVRMTLEDFAQARRHVEAWRNQVVIPLRVVRRELKGETLSSFHPFSPQLREQLKALELDAEKLQLEALEGWTASRFVRNAALASADLGLENMGTFLRMHVDDMKSSHRSSIPGELRDGLRQVMTNRYTG